MEIMRAHRQWASRPDDERFSSLQALHDACTAYAKTAREKDVPVSELRVEAQDDDVRLVGRANIPARVSNWAFGQLCARVGAPASYLRELPATLAAQNLNHGLARRVVDDAGIKASLLFHNGTDLILRALTSERYERVWNHEVTGRLLDWQSAGWEPAVPDRVWAEDQRNITALYASDHDMFAFLRTSNTLREPGTDSPIYRGVIVENSEVGASKLRMTRFGYRYMCGNHIIWGAEDVSELALRHVGRIRDRMSTWYALAQRYLDSSPTEEEGRIAAAKGRIIAGTKDEVLDALFGRRSLGLSRKVLEAGYDAALPDVDGSPNTAWGVVQGLTRYSQTLPYADERTRIDRAAGKVLEMAF